MAIRIIFSAVFVRVPTRSIGQYRGRISNSLANLLNPPNQANVRSTLYFPEIRQIRDQRCLLRRALAIVVFGFHI